MNRGGDQNNVREGRTSPTERCRNCRAAMDANQSCARASEARGTEDGFHKQGGKE